jgi:uncharacterized membrane protein YraQ (UPF0718 family)
VANGDETRETSANRAVLVYNVLRLALFAVCFGVGWFAGLRPVIAVLVLALLVSGVLSWFLLRRQREAMGHAVERTVERSRLRMAERAAAEDDYQPSG